MNMPQTYADYNLVIPVWGADYTKLCIEILLPGLMTESNLPAIASDKDVQISFCCPPPDRHLLEASEVLSALGRHADIVFLDNSEILQNDDAKHRAMTDSIYLALRHPRTGPEHTVLVFLNPDVVLSNEVFATITAAMARGRKALMMTGLRTRVDTIRAYLDPYRQGLSLPIPGSVLSRLALDHLHPFCSAYIWNRHEYPVSMPPLLFYETADKGLKQHCFHLHPIAVVCPRELPITQDTVDGDFLEKCGYSGEDYEIVTDGEGAVVVEMSGAPYSHPDKQRPGTPRRLAEVSVRVSDVHYGFFWHRIDFSRGLGPSQPCPELDRLLRYVKVHAPRRALRSSYPRLDKVLFRRLFRMAAWVVALPWPALKR